jgi:catechol 2,3-dioxygenase-like lactoylglutathione lyase family enzyme
MARSGGGPRLLGVIPWLACTDLRESIAFYVEVLGFAEEWSWGDPPTDAGVCHGNVRLYLFVNEELAARVQGSEITITAEDVDSLYVEHRRRGAPITHEIVNEPWGSREYHVEDPSGYTLRFSGEPR